LRKARRRFSPSPQPFSSNSQRENTVLAAEIASSLLRGRCTAVCQSGSRSHKIKGIDGFSGAFLGAFLDCSNI
jgi:hypothetical protein